MRRPSDRPPDGITCIHAADAHYRKGHFTSAKAITFSPMVATATAATTFRPSIPIPSSLTENLAPFIAGGVAGTVSASVMSPIDVVRTHLQATKGASHAALLASHGGAAGIVGRFKALEIAKNIAKIDGVKGFFRGLGPTLVGMLPHRSSQFWAYSTTRDVLSNKFGHASWIDMISAGVAGIVSNTVTNPIWLVKARIQLQAGADPKNPRLYRGYRDAVVRIWKEEGIRGFYKGVTASYWGISEAMIQFVVYERVKRKMIEINGRSPLLNSDFGNSDFGNSDKNRRREITPLQTLAAAAFSKCVASILTYPHEVVRTRMREQPRFVNALPKYRGMIQALKLIAREEGRHGLYAGIGAHLAKTIPNAAILFFTYETVKRWVNQAQRKP